MSEQGRKGLLLAYSVEKVPTPNFRLIPGGLLPITRVTIVDCDAI